MPIKTIDQSPLTTDTILFQILTPGPAGCFPTSSSNNTYRVRNVTIYFLERDYNYNDEQKYDFPVIDQLAQVAADQAREIACLSPSAATIAEAARLQAIADSKLVTHPIYYNNARIVQTFGTDTFPAWLITDPNDSILQIATDWNGDQIYGQFTLEWSPNGSVREGDYFICWTWDPLPAGSSLTSHLPFYLIGDTTITTTIPTHITSPTKYATLLDRYLPEMFKIHISKNDLTPEVLSMFHTALASSFSDMENLANQVIDLLDSNAIHESMIPYLSNFFGLKLRSGDPTLWRRQIKTAIPLAKQKGTISGLTSALSQAGISLNSYISYWQVVSKYTFTDIFLVSQGQIQFDLSRICIGTDSNFEILLRISGSMDYTLFDHSNVSITTTNGLSTMTWIGTTPLLIGDLIVVRYLIATVPNPSEQSIEDYIQNSLSLADQRDPIESYVDDFGNIGTRLVVPLKNWNVRIIDEGDPMFDVIVNEKNPYSEDVIFGKIRTEFAYSENLYNMDEYNGSLRDSIMPCDIDGGFIDVCSSCQSSKFSLDIEIEELSNDKIQEAQDIVTDYVPFHSVLHTLNVSGGIQEFLQPATEIIETLVMFKIQEYMIAGNANIYFDRYRGNGYSIDSIRRDMLADSNQIMTLSRGLAYNSAIALTSTNIRFDEIGLNPNTAVLEVLSPSPNSGVYNQISNPFRHTVLVAGVTEPFDTSMFTYRISQKIYFSPSVGITQRNRNVFSDVSKNFSVYDVISQADSGTSWSVLIPSYSGNSFVIQDILSDGGFLLNDPDMMIPSSSVTGINYSLLDGNGNTITTGIYGAISVDQQAEIEFADASISDVRKIFKIGYFVLYDGKYYPVIGFVSGRMDSVIIGDYNFNDGSAAGVPVTVYNRIVDGDVGTFTYQGMILDGLINVEQFLGIVNGDNPPDVIVDNNLWKENFLIQINDYYYKIEEIDGSIMTISGPFQNWGTLASGGVDVLYNVIKLAKKSITIDGQVFDYIDREGNDMVEQIIETKEVPVEAMALPVMNENTSSFMDESVEISEGLIVEIRDESGKIRKVKL